MDIEALKSALREGVVTIEFTKVNGLKRVMRATLAASMLPKVDHPLESANRNPNVNLVVWDVEQQGWRTVKVESIIEWGEGIAAPKAPEPKVVGDWKPAAPTPAKPAPAPAPAPKIEPTQK